MQQQNVDIDKLKTEKSVASYTYRSCAFCTKTVFLNLLNSQSIIHLSKSSSYCSFCLRNNFHHRSSSNVLMMSFRGIIGFYYHKFYNVTPPTIWLNQIQEFIDRHISIGLANPVFTYDPYTFLWFIDFNRIGKGSQKAPFAEVAITVKSMFNAFKLTKYRSATASKEMWDKFNKALKLFYNQRKRPKDRKMLIPTLSYPPDNSLTETARNFDLSDLVLKDSINID